MTAPANRWKLGLFVVGGAAISLLGLTWVGINELKRDFHLAYAYFDEALTGLEEGSPVRFRGVAIGVVKRIRVAPDQKHLEVQAALYDDYLKDLGLEVDNDGACPLPDNLRAQVVMSWVTSTAFIQVDYFPDPARGPQLVPFEVPPDHNTLRTVPSTAKGLEDASREVLRELPLMAIAARELIEMLRSEVTAARLPELSRQLQSVLQSADTVLKDVQQQGTVLAATAALTSLRDTATSLRDENGPIAVTLAELRRAADGIREQIAAARLEDTTSDVRAAAASIDGMGKETRAQLVHVRAALVALERLATLLERDPGALLHGRGATGSPLQESRR